MEIAVGEHDVGVLGVRVLDHLRHVEIAYSHAVHDGIVLVGSQYNFPCREALQVLGGAATYTAEMVVLVMKARVLEVVLVLRRGFKLQVSPHVGHVALVLFIPEAHVLAVHPPRETDLLGKNVGSQLAPFAPIPGSPHPVDHSTHHLVSLFRWRLGVLEDYPIGAFRDTPVDAVLEITLGVVVGCVFPVGAIVGDQCKVFKDAVIFHDLEILSRDEGHHLTGLAGLLDHDADVFPLCEKAAIDKDLILRPDFQWLARHRTGHGGKKATEADHSGHTWRETSGWQVIVHGESIIGWAGPAAGLLPCRFRNIRSSLSSAIKLRKNPFSRLDLREAKKPREEGRNLLPPIGSVAEW